MAISHLSPLSLQKKATLAWILCGSPGKPETKSMDKSLREKLLREEVIVVTERNLIQGTLCRHEDIRLSDAFNAPANQGAPYLSLANVKVTRVETGVPVFKARFLMVARAKIEFVIPISDVMSNLISDAASPPAELKGKWVNAEQLLEGIAPLIRMAE